MPPKKQKEQTFSLDQFAQQFGGSSNWAEDEAEFDPFNTMPTGGVPGLGAAAPTTSDWGARSSTFAPSSQGFGAPAQLPIPDFPPFSARVGNIAYECTEADLEQFFGAMALESVRLPRDDSGRIRGTAFIDFQTKEGLAEALNLSGTQMMGRSISINVAEQRQGGFSKPSFDWFARSQQQPSSFTPRPQQSSNRFDAGPSDWSQRAAPQVSRMPPAPKDWSQRSQQAPPHRERRPQPKLDWADRSQVQRPERRAPRGRSMAESSSIPTPSLDWAARSTPRQAGGNNNQFKKPTTPKPEEPKNNAPKVSNPYDLLRDD